MRFPPVPVWKLRESITATARQCRGETHYAYLSEDCILTGPIPRRVNCFMFTYEIFRRCGIFLPKPLPHQQNFGEPTEPALRRAGDLVFTDGRGFGHVGIVTEGDRDTVLHACWLRKTVVEDPFNEFIARTGSLRCVTDILFVPGC